MARSAWRAAVSLVPTGNKADLVGELCTQLGRGDQEVQRSLSRAIAALGDVILPMLRERASHDHEGIRTHAMATERLLQDPEEDFDAAVAQRSAWLLSPTRRLSTPMTSNRSGIEKCDDTVAH